MSTSGVRRARPLLGTLVEVSAWGDGPVCRGAVEGAFRAVARVQELMSVHDQDSELSRVNREALDRPVKVHPWTAAVLRFALRLHRESEGAFDCGVGSRLESAGFLPAGSARSKCDSAPASSGNVTIDAANRVRFKRPVCLDLGGIAKGYAVDRAVAALRHTDVEGGVINAGGDLRAFGVGAMPIAVRDPYSPGRCAQVLRLGVGAVATSAGYHAGARVRGRVVMPVYDPLRQRFLGRDLSVTVVAGDCMTADALTKVAAILGARAAPVLRHHGASALWWRRGQAQPKWEEPCAAAA